MGLDIQAYRQLKPDPAGTITLWHNQDFPGRADEFAADTKLTYTAVETFHFAAGSYGGYNSWRNQLATLAGYPEELHGVEKSHAAHVWRYKPKGPFVELIDFADNEGVLGTAVCQKLLQDFKELRDRAQQVEDYTGWFQLKYDEWLKAFELAADGGAVSFG